MPLHQNQDGTWQWGKSGKKYKKKQDAIKQMKAIFASGYVEKKASYKSYTDILGMIKKAAPMKDPTGFKSFLYSVKRERPGESISPVIDVKDPQQLNRYFKWKTVGWDDPKIRQAALKDVYFKGLYQRESSNNPKLLRPYKKGPKKGQIFAAGIGSVQQAPLDTMKQLKLLGKRTTLKDLANPKYLPRVKSAIEGLQEYYNKRWPRTLSYANSADAEYMYSRYNNGPKGSVRVIRNWGKTGMAPYQAVNQIAREGNIEKMRKDRMLQSPLYADLLQGPEKIQLK